MIEISLYNLSEVLNAELSGNPGLKVSEIITDSRSIVSSPKAVFFALKSERNDGHKFIRDLYDRGIINFIVSDFRDEFKQLEYANFLIVENTLAALQTLGKYHRDQFNGKVTVIIGSNGKTIVKEWLYQLLNEEFPIIRSPKSYNSQIGVPLSLCLLNDHYQTAFIEAGISMPGEMEILEQIIRPDTVIFTSLGEAHQALFSDKTQKAEEKLKMAINAKCLIYSPDYMEIDEAIKKTFQSRKKDCVRWTLSASGSDIVVESYSKQGNSTQITVNCKGIRKEFKIPFIDEASVKNAMTCLAWLLSENLVKDTILSKFNTLEPVEMRIEQKQGINNCILINDYYNSDIESLKIAVDLLKNLSPEQGKTLILSDIMQSGMNESDLYRNVADIIVGKNITKMIGIGENISMNESAFNKIPQTEFYISTKAFLSQDLHSKFKDEVILLKGSGMFRFKRISDILELKKHRTVLEINMEAIIHNLNYYKSLIPPETKKMVMVKALSYGSGTYEIAALLQHHGIDYLGVAFADEGVKLRKAGITSKIIVMNPDEDDINDTIDFHLEPEIYNLRILKLFNEHLEEYSGIKLPVHIKIDTGMKRLGFSENEIDFLIKELKSSDSIYVQSVFSHLAAADEPIHDAFTKQQIKIFNRISDKLEQELKYPFLRHILNTSGVERFPEAAFEMVRIGIGLYGFSSDNNTNLMNVSTLKTSITQIKDLKKDDTVGYGRKWKAETNTRIAVIPVGYADGLSRQLSNGRGEVLVNGKKVQIIGNVCMDMIMIDLGNIDAKEGDEVILFGDDYPASILAKKLNTIPYEIISGISERVKRIYKG
jgi:alanine racemase